MAKTLEVLISGKRAGQLHQANNGMLTFAYRAGYSTTPLSLTMPISGEVFGDKIIRPFLFGLLPDSYDVRRSLGLEYGVSPDNPFALLAHIGLDCPGAVQFCAESATEEVLHRSGSLIPISDSEIAARLARGRGNREARWETNQERWSLGGQQAKFALRRENNAWYSCAGSAATTHIFKPGIADLRLSALNEFVCLKLAKACDLAACDVAYEILTMSLQLLRHAMIACAMIMAKSFVFIRKTSVRCLVCYQEINTPKREDLQRKILLLFANKRDNLRRRMFLSLWICCSSITF